MDFSRRLTYFKLFNYKKNKITEFQIVGILKQYGADKASEAICREYNHSIK